MTTVAQRAACLFSLFGGGLALLMSAGCSQQDERPRVTLSGVAQYERCTVRLVAPDALPADTVASEPLDDDRVLALTQGPAALRRLSVRALNQQGKVLDSSNTDADGHFRLMVPAESNLILEVEGSSAVTGWGPLAIQDGQGETPLSYQWPLTTGKEDQTFAALIPSQRSDAGFPTTDSALPFQVFDALLRICQRVQAVTSSGNMPALTLLWQTDPEAQTEYGYFQNAADQGYISLSLLQAPESFLTTISTDTVLAHEFGHYLLWARGGDDNAGANHDGSGEMALDPTVAFSEGFAQGLGSLLVPAELALFMRDARDSIDPLSEIDDGGGHRISLAGAWNERSVTELVRDLGDAPADGYDHNDDAVHGDVGLLLRSISRLRDSQDLVTMHSMLAAVRAEAPTLNAAIDTLALQHRVHTDAAGLDDLDQPSVLIVDADTSELHLDLQGRPLATREAHGTMPLAGDPPDLSLIDFRFGHWQTVHLDGDTPMIITVVPNDGVTLAIRTSVRFSDYLSSVLGIDPAFAELGAIGYGNTPIAILVDPQDGFRSFAITTLNGPGGFHLTAQPAVSIAVHSRPNQNTQLPARRLTSPQ